MMHGSIQRNLEIVREKIARAAGRAGRRPEEIVIVAVAKTFPARAIEEAVQAGIKDIGESRVQEAEQKIKSLGRIARWHLVGHLQSNKARKAVELFDLIQSLDSAHLAETLDRAAAAAGKKVECLLEINSSGEASKFGILPSYGQDLLETIRRYEYISLRGIMTVGPLTEDQAVIRKSFRLTREIFERGRSAIGESFDILSMGMSDDYEMAIAEGATMVRLGTALFGQRGKD